MNAEIIAMYVFMSAFVFAIVLAVEDKIYEWRLGAARTTLLRPLRPGWAELTDAWCTTIWLTGFMGLFGALTLKGQIHGPVVPWFALALQLVPFWLFVSAVRKTKKWRRYGNMTVHLEPELIRLGGEIRGWLAVRTPDVIDEAVQVRIQCERNYPGEEFSNWETIWSKAEMISIAPQDNGGRIDFVFQIPAGLPVSEVKPRTANPSHHEWSLTVSNGENGRRFWFKYNLTVVAELSPCVGSSLSASTAQLMETSSGRSTPSRTL